MRLVMRERSLTRHSRSRLGRLASSSSIVGIATIPQCPRSPRNQPRNTRINIAASRRSVFARLRLYGAFFVKGYHVIFVSQRIIRGGSWGFSPQFLRAAYRRGNTPGDRRGDVGFRVARTLNP
jgi:hypothetical protein